MHIGLGNLYKLGQKLLKNIKILNFNIGDVVPNAFDVFQGSNKRQKVIWLIQTQNISAHFGVAFFDLPK